MSAVTPDSILFLIILVFLGITIIIGIAIVYVDAILPIYFGSGWRVGDKYSRYISAIIVLLAFILPILYLSRFIRFGALQFVDPGQWLILTAALVIGYFLGIAIGNQLLEDARVVVKSLIEAIYPPGGEISFGASDVNAGDRALSFLDQVGGIYDDLIYVLATAINSPIMSWALLSNFTPFTNLSPQQKQVFLEKWMDSSNLTFRSLSQIFKALACLGYYADPRVWDKIGYPGPFVPQFPDTQNHPVSLENLRLSPLDAGFMLPDIRPFVEQDETHPEIYGTAHFLRRKRRYKVVDQNMIVEADVCIIGSGAGGSLLAYELSKNPKVGKVVLLERGSYLEGEDFNQHELDMLSALWKGGALTFNRDYSIFVGQGETLGGTTVINHAICIDTPKIVLDEWKDLGIGEWFGNQKEIQRCLDYVKKDLNVKPVESERINANNSLLKEGAQKLGLPINSYGPNPRNCVDCQQCGFDHLGCHYDAKQSMLVTYIPKALDTGNCQVFCDTYVTKLVHDGRQVNAVAASFMDSNGEEKYRLTVKAKTVICSAGAINSTGLLLRSKIPDPYQQLGKGLSIHPSPLVIAEFDRPVRAYEGIPMSFHISTYSVMCGVKGILHNDPPVTSDTPEDQRGGFMLEAVFPNLGQFAAFLPGMANDHKKLMSRLNYYAAGGILIRDTPKGTVSINLSGETVVDYGLDVHDKRNLSNGIKKLAEIYFKVGAKRVIITSRKATIIEKDEYEKNPSILEEKVTPADCGQDNLFLGAVHPQGGNRAGTEPKQSVVDDRCIHHQLRNLLVCDASVFPTATGVNPMLTVLAIAKRTSENLTNHI